MIRAGPLSMNWLGIEMMYNGNGKGFRIDRRSSKNVQRPYEHILIGSGNRTTRAFSVLVDNPRLISHTWLRSLGVSDIHLVRLWLVPIQYIHCTQERVLVRCVAHLQHLATFRQ
jgi:hypothetical protein